MLSRPLPPSGRLAILRGLILIVGIVFIAQLVRIQFVQGQGLRARADENRFRLVEVRGQRGVMYDRNGQLLVRNRPSFDIVAIPSNMPSDEEQMRALLERLEQIIADSEADLPVHQPETPADPAAGGEAAAEDAAAGDEATPESAAAAVGQQGQPGFRQRLSIDEAVVKIEDAMQGGAYRPVVIAGRVSSETAFAVAEESHNLPGIQLSIAPVREYLTGPLTSQLIGFVGPIPEAYVASYTEAGYRANDQVGLAGLETTFEKALRGRDGRRNIEVDVNGREVRTVGDIFPSAPGNNLVLTVDAKLQALMEEALTRGLEAAKAQVGVAIAMDPKTGEVLGMVSLPTYDNNLFARGITAAEYQALMEDKRLPLLNHAISALYPPGSVFKIVASSGALQEGVIDETTRLGDSFDGPVAEIAPEEGNVFAFLRSDHSWHGHTPFVGERRVVQIAWLRDVAALERKRKRHRLSLLLKTLLRR